MGLDFEYINGQTPLDEDEKEGLLIPTIATRGELDEFEQNNIEETIQWIYGKNFKPEQIISEDFVKRLHKRMYGQVWAWAGDFRKTNKNIGVDKWQISVELKSLIDDTLFWIANKTYSDDEIALRFKHRLVSIHCFSNGNGRHSRLMADIIIEKIFNKAIYSWGSENLSKECDSRLNYLNAVRKADNGEIEPLLVFARQ